MLRKALPAMTEKGFEVTSVSGLLGSLDGN
jgi:hypothetical protein